MIIVSMVQGYKGNVRIKTLIEHKSVNDTIPDFPFSLKCIKNVKLNLVHFYEFLFLFTRESQSVAKARESPNQAQKKLLDI